MDVFPALSFNKRGVWMIPELFEHRLFKGPDTDISHRYAIGTVTRFVNNAG